MTANLSLITPPRPDSECATALVTSSLTASSTSSLLGPRTVRTVSPRLRDRLERPWQLDRAADLTRRRLPIPLGEHADQLYRGPLLVAEFGVLRPDWVSKPFLSTTIREAALVERQILRMATLATPTVRLRRLGAELKRIREDAGLSLDAAGVRLGRSASSLSKIENGRVVLPRRDLTYILDCYDVTDEPLREMLYALARDGRKKGWWRRYADTLSPAAQDYMSLEADAAAVRTFQPLVVPGLLQSESYARAVIEAGIPLGPRNVDRLLSIRMARQALLSAPSPPQIWLIIWEAVLRHTIGGRGVMAEQLARRLGARSNGGAW